MLAIGRSARLRTPETRRYVKRCSFSSAPAPCLDLRAPFQSYISTQRDPYLNLSIEHYLLENSSPDSNILFLYTNRPCIVVGRNQNPWVEVNIPLLRNTNRGSTRVASGLENVDLVRRRSGGGTVFHDEGNVNWSMICNPSNFTRDKHAELVVSALRGMGVDRARVNERHDIVLDQGDHRFSPDADPEDTHRTLYTASDGGGPRPLKVSGSAYKLTRTRSLHHATCLLSSPNLGRIPQFLHSPMRPYIKGRGVDSVSSPVGNIGVDANAFAEAIQHRFRMTYGGETAPVEVGEELLRDPTIANGYEELRSSDWIFGQTPQFDVSTKRTELSLGSGAESRSALAVSGEFTITVRHGIVEAIQSTLASADEARAQTLKGYRLYGLSRDKTPASIWEALADITRGADGSRLVDWLRHNLDAPAS